MTVFESPFGGVDVPGISITEMLVNGLDQSTEAPVLIDGPTGRAVTAAELVHSIQSFAGGLIEKGFGDGQVIALMAPNIPEYVTVFHGVAFAGGTVTTINPTYTAGEVRHQLNDSGATLLITTSEFRETAVEAVQGSAVRDICLIDGDEEGLNLSDFLGQPLREQVPVDTARHVVVLPYSSGTTGLPKGVMLSHDNLAVNVLQSLPGIAPQRGEVTIGFLPFFHIYGMTVLMNVFLSQGASVITMPRFDLEHFLRLAQDHKVRQLFIVPPVALALAKHPLVDQFDLSAVERAFSGAAPLGADTTAAVAARLGAPMVQGYGMTELSPVSHASTFEHHREGASGLTAPGTRCRIVAEDGRNLGPGEEGELWVKGQQVMLGYLNNAQATAETIVEDGWLRTGDVAEFDDDGYLYLRDRVKELIKVKGFQVAPAELEAVLIADPAIADAAVTGIADEEAGERPKAYVVRADGADIDEARVAAIISDQLASYKALGAVQFVDSIPKSASGKILRRMLRD